MARMPDQKIWFVRGLRAAGAAAAMPVDSATRSYAFELDQKGSKRAEGSKRNDNNDDTTIKGSENG